MRTTPHGMCALRRALQTGTKVGLAAIRSGWVRARVSARTCVHARAHRQTRLSVD